MNWETLLRFGEVVFAAGGAMMWVRSNIQDLRREVKSLRTEQGVQGLRLKRLARTVRRLVRSGPSLELDVRQPDPPPRTEADPPA